ncbi:MAG: flagellar basal body P-ring formation protein FlgA [Fibrobacteria bacterium]|nr:flagellar basal body P-ring formation protein FlgA [Fibrobacteria bacterium]
MKTKCYNYRGLLRAFPVILFLVGFLFAAQSKLQVNYFDEITVLTEEIKFEDIAQINGDGPEVEKLKKTIIGKAANYGRTRYLSTGRLYGFYLKALESKYDLGKIQNKRVRVITASRELTHDSLALLTKQFLDGYHGAPDLEYRYEFDVVPPKLYVPCTPYKLNIKALDTFERKGKQQLQLVISSVAEEEKVLRSIPFSIYIRLYDSVWVSSTRIGRAKPVGRQQLKKAFREITKLAGVPVKSLQALEGKLTRQTIIANRVITSRLIQLEPIVWQGQRVQVKLVRNGLSLAMDCIARQDGRLGQIIKLKNLVTHKIIRARVLEEGEMEMVAFATRG